MTKMRIWPYAGRSSESSRMIASTSGGVWFFRSAARRLHPPYSSTRELQHM